MLFNSLQFLLFFIVVTSAYFIVPHKYRWALLLGASCYFYMAFVPIYILILGFTIVIDYIAGIQIENAQGAKRKLFLVCSLVANIGVLVVFKYYNFINDNLTLLLHSFGHQNHFPFLSILLPIGLSFHTFQAMSYTIEVYRGNQKAERHFGIYSLYVMFYPQLVAGPIERPQNLLHQFREEHAFDYARVTSGLRLMLWGFFKKVVIADRLALVTDAVFGDPHKYNSMGLILGAFFFTYQIFFDFSGYSDIAIGTARVMGFNLMRNFNQPYYSTSISEFWTRWHISLSTWFKDYLYIPLGGNRVAIPRWCFNILIVFLLSGLWHGANWTFLIWGALHGSYMIFGRLTEKTRNSVASRFRFFAWPALSRFFVFTLVGLSWVFFKSPDVSTAFYIITHIFTGLPDLFTSILHHQSIFQWYNVAKFDLILAFILIAAVEFVHWLQRRFTLSEIFMHKPLYLRWAVYYGALFMIITYGVYFSHRQFIYFQF